MSHDPEHNLDEQRFAELLRAADADVPPPDPVFLKNLLQDSLEAFLAEGESLSWETTSPQSTATQSFPINSHSVSPSPINKPSEPSRPAPVIRNWSQFMLALAVRSSLAVSAAFVMFASWLVPFPDAAIKAGVPFLDVLNELREADSVHLELVKNEQTNEVWFRAPGLVRLDETPHRYQIAAGSRLWRVDEAANTVTESDSPWFLSPEKQINLLGLLDVGIKDGSAMLQAKPIKRTMHDGKACLLYRVELPTDEGRVEVEALADAGTKQFVALMARRAAEPGDAVDANPPLAELKLVALNVAVADEKFAVSKSLTEDGRIGTIRQPQGIVTLRPVLAKRWTPLFREVALRPGDWLRTELRGANAVKVVLSSDTVLTLGPGTQLECLSPTQARIHSGEVQVALSAKPTAFELLAPRKATPRKFDKEGKTLLRVDRDEQLVDVPQTPLWLAGFEGTSNNESLGSLIVKLPDGRNEPLTVGYHKVSVEIRDQIARTTIEESFVNHTKGRLEGIFHFPLPQDASISGFGMWIGNELVEADVVEKQRAREIYETILREKRDPGLLEWTGGNIFKARVFPIEPQSEKRVKIVYTQVLPVRANRYRYSYGLRSEMLRTKPLRELAVSVTVSSALPLKDISCPTHTVRRQLTAHSAQLEFAAQEYSPTRDFEVVCDIDGKQSDVVVIPHRRGADGYLLVQVTPPVPEGNWTREVLPDGAPLQVVLLCDTSGSMDTEKRKQQSEFVASVLASLGANDRFSLVAADVNPVWAAPEPMAATADNIAKAEKFLADRISLGWTDLDRAFTDVLKKAPANAQVIYIGDGLVSARDSDPHAFVNRVERLVQDSAAGTEKRRGFHAVTVGNTFDVVALKGIAGLGGGSVRSIVGEQTPQSVALELLNEIAQPGLSDLKVEFRGLKVAAVYPDRLPNLPAGTQQILVGRYLPEGKDQHGEVVVTGKRGSESIRYVAKVDLSDAEAGNSFIPRLWARAHLDHLLQQGGDSVRDDIIRLSEEFHIITPYTSLLVLESDADRERFGVQRRYEMRDGERFFAEGRANANFELLQQQMKLAGNWRQGLRRQIMRSWADLGRHPAIFQRQVEVLARIRSGSGPSDSRDEFQSYGRRDAEDSPADGLISSSMTRFSVDNLVQLGDFAEGVNGPMAGGMGGMGGGRVSGGADWYFRGVGDKDAKYNYDVDSDGELFYAGQDSTRFARLEDRMSGVQLGFDTDESSIYGEADFGEVDKSLRELSIDEMDFAGDGLQPASKPMGFRFQRGAILSKAKNSMFGMGFGLKAEAAFQPALGRRGRGSVPDYNAWIQTLFPHLKPAPLTPSAPAKDPETWPAEAIALSRSLLRVESLRKLEGGLELRRVAETFDPRWNRRDSKNSDLVLYSPTAWLTRTLNLGTNVIVDYCQVKERGVFSAALLLGRVRPAVQQDLQELPLGLYDLSLSPMHETMRVYKARVEPAGENLLKLILTLENSTYELQFTIDTAKHVLVKQESLDEGKVTGTTIYSDFVQVAGTWWARKSVITDAKGQKIGENTWDIEAKTQAEFQQRIDAELAVVPHVQFMHFPLVKQKLARQKVADGSAGFDERLRMLTHAANLQQWDDVLKHVEAIEKLAAAKAGVRWIRPLVLAAMRRNNETRLWYLDEARRIAANKISDDLYLSEFILGQSYGISSWAEYLELVQVLKPVYERQPAELAAISKWQEKLASCYEPLNRNEEALAIRKSLTEQSPWNLYAQIDFARRLQNAGQTDASLAWLQRELDRKIERNASEVDALNSAFITFYRAQARWDDLLKFTLQGMERNPENASIYSEHLSALIFNNQLDAANALVESWLREAQVEGKLPSAAKVKLDTALNFALGQIPHISVQRMGERWNEPLAAVARFFARHKHHFEVTQRVMGNYYFTQSDDCDRLRGEFLELLQAEVANVSMMQLTSLVQWTIAGRIEFSQVVNGRRQMDASEVELAVWEKIAASVQARWAQAADKQEKHAIGETLLSIYANRFRDTHYMPFLRERIGSAPPEFKPGYVSALFEALLTAPWSEQVEQEVFARWRELSEEKEPVDRLIVLIPALNRIVDQMVTNRVVLATKAFQDQGGTEKLTRQELAKKRSEIRIAAQQAVATRLAAEAAQEQNTALAAWMRIERSWLDIQLSQRLAEAEAECWKLLGDAPPKPEAKDEDNDEPKHTIAELKQEYFDTLLRQRAFTTLLNLATRRSAAAPLVDKLLKFVDTGIGYGGDVAANWRSTKFQLLVALDRPDELEKELRTWIAADVSTAPWRIALGRLVAERGKVEEAVKLLEACEKDKLLSAEDYRSLADWYLALNQRESYARARIEAFKQTPEHVLSNMTYQMQNRWNQQGPKVLSEVDENSLFAWKALLEKTAQPENYLSQLRYIYAASRDFRLLQMLPDAALGRTPQQAYTLIIGIQSQILYELRNEATADEIIARIKKLREGERTPTDLRALDLFEAVVERKSSEILNQPGPHVEATLTALKRAFERKWSDGEHVLMAQFLRDLGALPQPQLVEEQLRQLKELQKLAVPESREHLQITEDYCQVLFGNYQRHDEALREMEVCVTAYDRVHKGQWPHQDNEILSSYVHFLEETNRHHAGESVLQKYLAKPEQEEQQRWLKDRLLGLYNHALQNNGTVSLGSGEELFQNLVTRDLDEIQKSTDENVRYQIVVRLTGTFNIAHQKAFPAVHPTVGKFAFEVMPQILKRQIAQYRNTAAAPMGMISEVLGARDALRYVVERMEQYPASMELEWQSSWYAFGNELATRIQQMVDAKRDLGDLDARVLKLVTHELRRELRTGENRNRNLYHRYYNYFWAQKTDDFARVANEVFAERKTSGRRAMLVARYLWEGLTLHPRAVEIMFLAHKDGLLDISEQTQLVNWLHSDNRFAEMISLLEPLVAKYPDNLQYRTQLMAAYFRTQRPEQLADLTDKTDKHFHQGGRWNEGNIAALARACRECGLTARSVALFNEALSVYQRNHPGSGAGDQTLSALYQDLALAQSTLGHTKEAVDAASAALVCWPALHEQRTYAVQNMANVLNSAKDLDAYVKYLDDETSKSGQDSPILRKQIGLVYQRRGQWDQAIVQLRLVVALQPNDKEVHKALMQCFDAGDPAKYKGLANKQLLMLIDLERHDLTLYQQLAERMKGDEAEAERAATSLIEAAPNESENQTAMAEWRQKQDRWDEAIPHWEQVAKLRKLEPTGLLKLAEAQIHQKRWDAAKKSLQTLQKTAWPSRFGDVHGQAQHLLRQVP